MTAAQALAGAIRDLRRAGVDDPARDARRLLAHAMKIAPGRLGLHLGDDVDAALAQFETLIQHRAQRQPVSQLIGGRYFYDHWFEITPDVLDPRPETEILVGLALQQPFATVLDMGTGSGAILLSLLAAVPGAFGTGSELSQSALEVARRNAAGMGLADRVAWRRSDWFDAVDGTFDLIVSNPPYIADAEMAGLAPELLNWEPRMALTDGADGLSAYRAIAAGAADHLVPGGRLLVEIGAGQGEAVCRIFADAGLGDAKVHPDLDGRDRVIAAQSPHKA